MYCYTFHNIANILISDVRELYNKYSTMVFARCFLSIVEYPKLFILNSNIIDGIANEIIAIKRILIIIFFIKMERGINPLSIDCQLN